MDNVMQAAKMIAAAAAEMSKAAKDIQSALREHQRFLDDWLTRQRMPTDQLPPKPPGGAPSDGWEEWKGGFQPAEGEVWIKRRDGVIARAYANEVGWRHYREQRPNDIMAWRPA